MLNNSSNVFLNSDPVFFFNYWLSMKSGEHKMRIKIVVFYFHV